MLIKSQRKGSLRSAGWFVAGASILLVILIFTAGRPMTGISKTYAEEIYCDLESVEDDMFITDDRSFYGAETRSDRRARSGSYSSRLGGETLYGLRYDMEDPQPGDFYEVTVWASRTGGDRGILAVSAEDQSLYKQIDLPVLRNEKGWEMLELHFRVPDTISSSIRIYTYVPDNSGDVYFDDLRIRKVKYEAPTDPEAVPQYLELSIEKKDYQKLENKKWDAVSKGILITEEDDWVKGKVSSDIGGTDIPVKLRLKGDWLDHLQARKWSFRIKVKDPYSWNQLITFSIQSPETRMFMREWVYHRFLELNDVLTPRYDFLNVELNDRSLGVYAWEEHFDKQLVESKQRREGPIIKLTEDGFWMSYKVSSDLNRNANVQRLVDDAMWDSEVRPFKEARTAANPALTAQFERAQNLLFGFKYEGLTVSEVFDVDLMARYHAVTDLLEAYHGITWHNIRFYYNPVTARIEPIGYDGFGTQMTFLENGPFFGYYAETNDRGELLSRLFADPGFVRRYHSYLARYTDPAWLDEQLTLMQPEIDKRNGLIRTEYPNGVFQPEELHQRARKIHHYLLAKEQESLSVRTIDIKEDVRTVALINQHPLSLDAIGYTNASKEAVVRFDRPIHITRGGKYEIPEIAEGSVPVRAAYIAYQVAGLDSIYFSPILDFKPAAITKYNTAGENFNADKFNFIRVAGDEVVIRSGSHQMAENLDIPAGYSLLIEPGTELNVTNNARIVVRGPVLAPGTTDEPIIIRSSDNSASGFTVLNASQRSELSHVEFRGFNTLRETGWTLTGAVTFYESDIRLRNCRFIGNMCEDGLNTIRSHIDIEGIYIGDTQFDGFDSDFCRGTISSAYFENTGNDAIDFSGSDIEIDFCSIKSAGDKGISVGEESRLSIEKAIVSGCNIAVASKDLSVCDIKDITISECKQGFTAYQKKPEFGPAVLNIGTYNMTDVDQPYLIERGSQLSLGDKKIEGDD